MSNGDDVGFRSGQPGTHSWYREPPDSKGLAGLLPLLEMGVDFTPLIGDLKALFYDTPKSLGDAWHADTPLGKAGHVGLATLAGLSAIPLLGAPLDAARAAIKARRLSNPDRIAEQLSDADRIAHNKSLFKGGSEVEGSGGLQYPDIYYHGTYKPMDPDNPWTHLEPSDMGRRGPGIYFDAPQRANAYTDSSKRIKLPIDENLLLKEQPRMYPVVVRQDRLADLTPLHSPLLHEPDAIKKLVKEYGEVVRPPAARHDRSFGGEEYANYLKRRNDALQRRGYHGIRSAGELVMFDPQHVRSPWARFEDLNSKDLLAGITGLGFSSRLAQSREDDG